MRSFGSNRKTGGLGDVRVLDFSRFPDISDQEEMRVSRDKLLPGCRVSVSVGCGGVADTSLRKLRNGNAC